MAIVYAFPACIFSVHQRIAIRCRRINRLSVQCHLILQKDRTISTYKAERTTFFKQNGSYICQYCQSVVIVVGFHNGL